MLSPLFRGDADRQRGEINNGISPFLLISIGSCHFIHKYFNFKGIHDFWFPARERPIIKIRTKTEILNY